MRHDKVEGNDGRVTRSGAAWADIEAGVQVAFPPEADAHLAEAGADEGDRGGTPVAAPLMAREPGRAPGPGAAAAPARGRHVVDGGRRGRPPRPSRRGGPSASGLERDRSAFDRGDPSTHDRIQREMLDQDAWPTARLMGLAEHHARRLEVAGTFHLAELRDPTGAMTLVCALLTIAGRPATDVRGFGRRESLFFRAIPIVCDGVACFLGATLRRDRIRLGLIAEAG